MLENSSFLNVTSACKSPAHVQSILNNYRKVQKMNAPTQVTKTVWTPRDEATLQELLERKTRVVDAGRLQLMGIVAGAREQIGQANRSHDGAEGAFEPVMEGILVDYMIQNAAAFRDALAQFVETQVTPVGPIPRPAATTN